MNIPHKIIECTSRIFEYTSRFFEYKSQDFRIKQRLQAICDWVSIYNGHLRGPVTRTPIVERLAVELSLPVFTTYVCHGWDSNKLDFTLNNFH